MSAQGLAEYSDLSLCLVKSVYVKLLTTHSSLLTRAAAPWIIGKVGIMFLSFHYEHNHDIAIRMRDISKRTRTMPMRQIFLLLFIRLWFYQLKRYRCVGFLFCNLYICDCMHEVLFVYGFRHSCRPTACQQMLPKIFRIGRTRSAATAERNCGAEDVPRPFSWTEACRNSASGGCVRVM